jgi:hypothetical protein
MIRCACLARVRVNAAGVGGYSSSEADVGLAPLSSRIILPSRIPHIANDVFLAWCHQGDNASPSPHSLSASIHSNRRL